MKVLLALAALALAGCATSPQAPPVTPIAAARAAMAPRTVTVTTEPVDAHVRLVVEGDPARPPLAEGNTKDRKISFILNVPDSVPVVAEATAPGYQQRPYIHSESTNTISLELTRVRE
jgi:hypothetical protein